MGALELHQQIGPSARDPGHRTPAVNKKHLVLGSVAISDDQPVPFPRAVGPRGQALIAARSVSGLSRLDGHEGVLVGGDLPLTQNHHAADVPWIFARKIGTLDSAVFLEALLEGAGAVGLRNRVATLDGRLSAAQTGYCFVPRDEAKSQPEFEGSGEGYRKETDRGGDGAGFAVVDGAGTTGTAPGATGEGAAQFG